MRLLVTGGCGFIGSNFIRLMLKKYKDISIRNLDKLTYCGNPDNLKDIEDDSRYSFIKGDICDRSSAGEAVKDIDAVVNFAAESHVDRSIKYPDEFLRTNVLGVEALLEASRKAKVKKFVQIGTDEVYGSVPEGFSKEDDSLRPNSPYSASKAAGDLLARSFYITYGLPVVIVRSSNNFGPYQYPEKAIPLFITNLLKGEKIPLYGDGSNVRDWLFVEDNCEAVDLVLQKGEPGEIYNAGGGTHLSNMDLVKDILSIMEKDMGSVENVKDRPGHDRRYALDSGKMQKLGWKTGTSFKDNLKKTIEWYKDNETWWTSLKEKAEIIKW